MANYIDRDELLKYINSLSTHWLDEWDTAGILGAVYKQPTIDVFPVVNCEECKHKEECQRQMMFTGRDHVCEINTYEYHKVNFCSYGERKDNG